MSARPSPTPWALIALLLGSKAGDAVAQTASTAPTMSTLVTAPTTSGAAEGPVPPPMPWTGLGDYFVTAFSSTAPLVSYAVAIGATATMVMTGTDQQIRVFAQREIHTGGLANAWDLGAVYGGYTLPVVVPLVMFGLGSLARAEEAAGAGAAALQALGVTFVTVTLLKVGTGRPFPNHGGDPNDEARLDHDEYAREFRPFHLSGFYAWPSGHAASSISVAAALTGYYRGSVAVPLIAYPVATLISLGMIVGDHHWGSDVVAGALIGQSVGYTVGTAFREESTARGEPGLRRRSLGGSVTIVPIVSGDTRGLMVAGGF